MAEASLRAVILDWAGTLVDFGSCAPAGAFVELFAGHNVPITAAQAREPMGLHKRDHIAALLAMPAVAAAWRDATGRAPGPPDVGALYEELIPLQLEALPRYAALVPGALDAIAAFRERGLAIGTTTGYNRAMVDVLLSSARAQGFTPDASACVDDVPAGRPEPWMALRCAEELRAYPLDACVKAGDTVPDIEEGRNAGMWTVAVARTGNEVGLTEAELAALAPADREARLARARERLRSAHYVVDGIADMPRLLDEIERRRACGERP